MKIFKIWDEKKSISISLCKNECTYRLQFDFYCTSLNYLLYSYQCSFKNI